MENNEINEILERRPRFLMYLKWYKVFMGLTDDEAGVLIKAIYEYIVNSVISDELLEEGSKVKFVFDTYMKDDFDKDTEKYIKTSLTKSSNAKARYDK